MAYGLKYTTYKVVGDTRYTLRIYQKDYNGASFGIGTLTGFSLQIQGDQSSLIAPIIKTSVNISLKDFFNRGTTQSGVTCIEDGEKMGQWEEFYTRDPLKYRIDVLVGASNPTTIWSGYLTPDSWGEEMQYGGDINLTARDMLGYLDEQEFDLTGRTSIQNLIQSAITKSASPMAVAFSTGECLYNTNGQSILAATIDASTYSGNTWYQALEKCLESLGLVLRYNGDGGFFVTSLRYLALHTHEYSTAMFTGRSGYRTLDPAVKQIVETFDPKWVNFDVPDAEADNVSQASGTWTCRHYWVQWHEYSVQKYQITGDTNWTGYAASLPNRTPYKNALKRNIYLPFNTTTDVGLVFRRNGFIPPCKVVLALSAPHRVTANIIHNEADDILALPETSVDAVISVVVGNTTYYLTQDYVWDRTSHSVNIKPDAAEIELPSIGDGDASDFRITFNRANMADWVGANGAPFYMAVDVEFQPIEGKSTIAGEYKTTTIYNENNHTEISRDPSVGAATGSTNIDFVPNLLAYGYSIATDAWKFYGDANTFPLAVMIHAQIIVYYGQMEDSQGRETGNSIFTGNFIDSEQTPLVPATRYTYFGKTCTLLSGAYNFLTGGVDSATLREFFTWSSVWDTFDPTYSVKTSRNEGGTASAGGGGSASGGGGSTGGSVTSVDMSVPTGMTIGGNPITTRGTLALGLAEGYNFLTDTYKATLDGHLADRSSNPHNVTLAQAAGQSLADKLTALASWFEYDENNHAIRVKEYIGESQVKTSFYAYGEVTAGGIGSGGGGGGAAIWGAITGTLSNQTDLMAALNGKASASHTHTIGNITGLQDALDGKQALITSSNKLAYSLISGTPDLSVYATTSALAAHTGDTTIHITASERSTWNGKQDALGYTPVNKAGDTMSGTLVVAGNANQRGTIHLISSADIPNDLYFGTNGVGNWLISSRSTSEGRWIGLFNAMSNAWAMIVSADNKIGIGDSIPSYNLDVSGTLNATTIYQNGSALASLFAPYNAYGYLPLNGGTISGSNGALQIWRNDANSYSSIKFYNTVNSSAHLLGYLGFDADGEPCWSNDSDWFNLYHTGNANTASVAWQCSSLNVNNGGITNAGAINGATTIGSSFFRTYSSGVSAWGYISTDYGFLDWGSSGYAGIFANTGKELKLGSNNQYQITINTSGYVGIGTVSPSVKLEVVSGSSPALRLRNTGGNMGIIMTTDSSKYNWLIGAQYNIDNGFEITPSSGVGTTSYPTPAISVLYDGNVGIGTTSPANKLDVNGDGRFMGALNVSSTGSNRANINLITTADLSNDFYFGNNGAGKWSITSRGSGESYIIALYAAFGVSTYVVTTDGYSGNVNFKFNVIANGEITAGSDLRWKSNISSLTDYKSILRALNPVEWDWKEGHGNGHSCGFIAQDIKDIMPYAVKGNEKDGYTLNYNTFHAVWATALRNHETRVEYLERRVKELENRIAQLS